jgi:cytochrome c5
MSKQQVLTALAVALLSAAAPANAQQAQADFPDGPGKQTFVNFCGGCHDINRSRAGYTPEG